MTDMMRIIGIAHALQLCHMPIKKDIIYIKLANAPLKVNCNAKHSTNGDQIYHEIESLMKVNAWLLVKAFSNNASFIPCNRAVMMLFNAKHSFVSHYIMSRARGN